MELFPAPRPRRCATCPAPLPPGARDYCSKRCRWREEKRRQRRRQRAGQVTGQGSLDERSAPDHDGQVTSQERGADGGQVDGRVSGHDRAGERSRPAGRVEPVTGHVERGRGDAGQVTGQGSADERSVVVTALGLAAGMAVRARRSSALEAELVAAQDASAARANELASLRARVVELERDAGALARIVETAFAGVGWDGYEESVRALVDRNKGRGR